MPLQQPKRLNLTYWLLLCICFVFIFIILLSGSYDYGDDDDDDSSSRGGGGGGIIIAAELSRRMRGYDDDDDNNRVISTNDIVNGKYYGKGPNCSFTPNNLLSWQSLSGDIVTFDWRSQEKEVVIKANQFVSRPWKTKFSEDLQYVLVAFQPRRLYRSTILAKYSVHSSKSGNLLKTLSISDHDDDDDDTTTQFQLALWNNDNKTILTVHQNDIYALRLENNGESLKRLRITYDGSESIFNGVSDWVYEEELFTSSNTAIFPSPQGQTFTFLKFNDTSVSPVSYNLYGDFPNPEFQYPRFGNIRYPKAGTSNPVVSIHTVDIANPNCWEEQQQQLPKACIWSMEVSSLMESLVNNKKEEEEYLIGSLKYTEPNSFTMYILNRIQNSSWLVSCSVSSRRCELIRNFQQSNGWIDNKNFFKSGDTYYTIVSVENRGLLYGSVVGVTDSYFKVITSGAYTVDEIEGVYNGSVLVFKAGLLGERDGEVVCLDATQAHYYKIDLVGGGGGANKKPVCVSCYSDCTYSTGKWSNDGSVFVNNCERVESVGSVDVVEVIRNRSVYSLEKNEALARKLSSLDQRLPEVDYFSIPYKIVAGGTERYLLNCKVIGPKGWKKGGRGEYPLIVDIYGGPNSQKVVKKFTPNDWSYALASRSSSPVVYLIIDGLGSGRQSDSLAFEVYRGLGGVEIFDKIYGVKWFLGKYSSLDPERTLVWGWSYGGYVSSSVMGRDSDRVLKCAVAIAPVVDWHYYDTIYTERYMSTPEDNEGGYNSSSVLNYLDNFRGKRFLLVHGNADDNVHYQQSMVLARGLEQKDILFRMQSYPDENHSLGGVRSHLFHTLEDFVFDECFRR